MYVTTDNTMGWQSKIRIMKKIKNSITVTFKLLKMYSILLYRKKMMNNQFRWNRVKFLYDSDHDVRNDFVET